MTIKFNVGERNQEGRFYLYALILLAIHIREKRMVLTVQALIKR